MTVRIKTDEQYDWRNEQYEQAAQQLGEVTKSKGIDAATAFAIEMLSNLERAIDHPDMTEELAEVLSTEQVRLTYEVTTAIDVNSD